MIKHHVPYQMLEQFIKGELNPSLSAAVSIHVDMCPECRAKAEALQSQQAQAMFDGEEEPAFELTYNSLDMADMIDTITADVQRHEIEQPKDVVVTIGPVKYKLHRALQSMDIEKSFSIGKVSRAKIELDEGNIHTHLLHMEPGGEVPQHTHTGFEVTLLLKGSFEDELGSYEPGDFIVLDGVHTHTPKSIDGCVCLTVVSDPLKFTSGLSKLLNPIGKYLY